MDEGYYKPSIREFCKGTVFETLEMGSAPTFMIFDLSNNNEETVVHKGEPVQHWKQKIYWPDSGPEEDMWVNMWVNEADEKDLGEIQKRINEGTLRMEYFNPFTTSYTSYMAGWDRTIAQNVWTYGKAVVEWRPWPERSTIWDAEGDIAFRGPIKNIMALKRTLTEFTGSNIITTINHLDNEFAVPR